VTVVTLQALSLVEKAEPLVQVRGFTLGLRDQRSEYVNGKMDVKSAWILTWHRMDHVSWSLGLFARTRSGAYANYAVVTSLGPLHT
jgi:hypothetical protein